MRWAVCLVLGACGFTSSPGTEPIDAPPDVPLPVKWDVDPMSKKAVPATALQWSELIAARGLNLTPPTDLWLMQEGNGTLADTIGTNPLMPLNFVTYGNTVPGWSRQAVGTIDTAGDRGFLSTTTGNLNVSYLLLLYVAITTTPSTTRGLVGIGSATDHRYVAITPSSTIQAAGFAGTPVSGTSSTGSSVHPIVLKLTPSTQSYIVYSDQEKITSGWVAPQGLGNLLIVGSAGAGSAPALYLYGGLWSGGDTDISDDGVKALLQGLGWTVVGY